MKNTGDEVLIPVSSLSLFCTAGSKERGGGKRLLKDPGRAAQGGHRLRAQAFHGFCGFTLSFPREKPSAALSKTSIFMPNKWHTMGLGSHCISTFQNHLVVEGMPSPTASLAFQALWSLGMEAFPLNPAGEDVVILVSIAVPLYP